MTEAAHIDYLKRQLAELQEQVLRLRTDNEKLRRALQRNPAPHPSRLGDLLQPRPPFARNPTAV